MPTQFKDPKLRSADFAIRLMATTAEHVRDCQRCYEILVRGLGEKLDEMAEIVPDSLPVPPASS